MKLCRSEWGEIDLTPEERATVCAVMGGAGSVREGHEVALITPT